jgi:hypothetical protein
MLLSLGLRHVQIAYFWLALANKVVTLDTKATDFGGSPLSVASHHQKGKRS